MIYKGLRGIGLFDFYYDKSQKIVYNLEVIEICLV